MTRRSTAARAPARDVERVAEPVFRCTVALTSVSGISFKRGETSTRWGSHWPGPEWSPENESARRLANYYSKYRASRFLPVYPAEFDGISRRYYLPAGIPLGRYPKDGQVIDVLTIED